MKRDDLGDLQVGENMILIFSICQAHSCDSLDRPPA